MFKEQLITAISIKIKAFFNSHNIKYRDNSSFEQLILQYFNFKDKSIFRKVGRHIEYSKEVQTKINGDAQLKNLLDFFVNKIKNGDDLIDWQSRTLFDAEKPDWLFNHWNIKHLHMTKDKSRSDKILLLIETSTDVYIVNIISHPKKAGWTAFDFLKILHNNQWLHLVGFYASTDIIPDSLEPKITNDEDIYCLYKMNFNIMFEIENVPYISLSGVATSGDKISHSRWLTCFNKWLQEFSSNDIEFISFDLGAEISFGLIRYRYGYEQLRYEIPNF